VDRFTYAIRNIVAEAQKVEAAGTRVRYLNIGDPIAFGFKTPAHLITAVERAMRDGHNHYGPSAGIPAAREAVAEEYTRNGFPIAADRVFITGTSEASTHAGRRRRRAARCSSRPYRPPRCWQSTTPNECRLDATRGWMPDRSPQSLSRRPRALVIIIPTIRPAPCSTETRRALLDFADQHGLLILADEVYGDLGFDGPIDPYGKLDPDAPIISFSSLSKAYLAPGWRTGWMACGRSPRLDGVVAAVKKLADGRLCSNVPMQYAIAGALNGDRSHQPEFRKALKARADLTVSRLCAMPGVSCVAPTAAFYAMPQITLPPGRTDEDYVKALLHATGVLCVYGSGFGLPAEEGFLRIVFLAPLDELTAIYDLMASFTADYLR
jgi:alanine-synthesizing transaminase